MNRCVLIVDDDPNLLDLLRAALEGLGYDIVTRTSAAAALRELGERDFGVVLTDVMMPGMSGIDLCREIVLRRETTPVVVMTALASMESAIAAIRVGAYDFVLKPFDVDALVVSIERALRHAELHAEVTRLRDTVNTLRPFSKIVGESAAMKRMLDMVARVAQSDATVLVTGESGTGKELVAQALHAHSGRASGPFVAINCAAMPESLLESELFGHVKGAFTDARKARAGLVLQATGGTLLLDEIGEMALGMQAKLLRALQERVVRPVGGDADVPFDTRVVAASNRELDQEVEQGRFRADLFYRLDVVHVEVPPLRARENDVLLLAHAFLERQTRVVGFASGVGAQLQGYPWPGNVRELQNCIERAVAVAQSDHILPGDLPERIAKYRPSRIDGALDGAAQETFLTIDEVERRYYTQVLDACGGSKAAAARTLGVDRRTLYRKLAEWRSDGKGERRDAEYPLRSTKRTST